MCEKMYLFGLLSPIFHRAKVKEDKDINIRNIYTSILLSLISPPPACATRFCPFFLHICETGGERGKEGRKDTSARASLTFLKIRPPAYLSESDRYATLPAHLITVIRCAALPVYLADSARCAHQDSASVNLLQMRPPRCTTKRATLAQVATSSPRPSDVRPRAHVTTWRKSCKMSTFCKTSPSTFAKCPSGENSITPAIKPTYIEWFLTQKCVSDPRGNGYPGFFLFVWHSKHVNKSG